MATEPIQSGPYPVPADPPDGPNQMSAIVTWAAGRLNMRFASTAARDAAIPSPTAGMECVIGSGASMAKHIYDGTRWRLFYEDTGWVNCISTAADSSAGSPGFNATGLQVRRDRGRVELRGTVVPTGNGTLGATATNVAQIPDGFRRLTGGYFGGGLVIAPTQGFNFVWLFGANGMLQVRNFGVSASYSTSSAFAPPSGWYVD